MVVPQFVVMNLTSDVCEAFAESHDKVSHVMDDLVFKNSLINVLFSLTQLLCIDKIQ